MSGYYIIKRIGKFSSITLLRRLLVSLGPSKRPNFDKFLKVGKKKSNFSVTVFIKHIIGYIKKILY